MSKPETRSSNDKTAGEGAPYAIFLLLRTMPAWLSLAREERNNKADEILGHAFKDKAISVRLFDAEAFHGNCTDVAFVETSNLREYYYSMERLRDTAFFSTPYFEIVDVIPAIEGGFREFEAVR